MSRAKLIATVSIIAIITAALYGYSFYLQNIKAFSINKSVKCGDILVDINEVLLIPRFTIGEPFYRELTVTGTVTDISKDSKYAEKLSQLVKVYVKDGPGMGFEQHAQTENYFHFRSYKIYDGNKTVNLIIDNGISKQNIPFKIDLREYNGHWIKENKTKNENLSAQEG